MKSNKNIIKTIRMISFLGLLGLVECQKHEQDIFNTPNHTSFVVVNVVNETDRENNYDISSLEHIPDAIQQSLNEVDAKITFTNDCGGQERKEIAVWYVSEERLEGFARDNIAYVKQERVFSKDYNKLGILKYPVFLFDKIFERKYLINGTDTTISVALHEYGHLADNCLFHTNLAPKGFLNKIGHNIRFGANYINLISQSFSKQNLKNIDDFVETIFRIPRTVRTNIPVGNGDYFNTVELSSTPEFLNIYFEYQKDEKLSFYGNGSYGEKNHCECFAETFRCYYETKETRKFLKDNLPRLYYYMKGLERRMIEDGSIYEKQNN